MTASEAAGPPGWAARGGATLPRLAIGMFVLLAIEFLLGMALALFASLPTDASAVALLSSAPVLDLHILIAVLIIGISARAVALAAPDPDRRGVVAAAIALGSALVATAAGATFAFHGQAPVASFGMAIGFLGVTLGAFLLRGLSTSAPSDSPHPDGTGGAHARV